MSRPSETMGGIVRDPYARPTPTAAAGVATIDIADESAVSWAAILAGAATAAALSLILVLLGTGLGLSSVSPWSFEGVSAETFGWATIAWISFTSIVASGLGGYLTGRLRRKWPGVAGDETYFRDTAHGFLAWGVATLLTATLLTTAIGSLLGSGVRAGAALAGAAADATAGLATPMTTADEENDGLLDYYVDRLFRGEGPASSAAPLPATPPPGAMTDTGGPDDQRLSSTPDAQRRAAGEHGAAPSRREAALIITHSLRSRSLDQEDTRHLGQLVSQRTGLSPREAEARVTQVHADLLASMASMDAQARELADDAREASAYAALWLFITLLMGAFTASLLATVGGRHRDL